MDVLELRLAMKALTPHSFDALCKDAEVNESFIDLGLGKSDTVGQFVDLSMQSKDDTSTLHLGILHVAFFSILVASWEKKFESVICTSVYDRNPKVSVIRNWLMGENAISENLNIMPMNDSVKWSNAEMLYIRAIRASQTSGTSHPIYIGR